MSGVDRELATPEQSIGAMQARLDAVEARLGAGLARLPTGTPQWTFATIPPPGTLLLQGQTVLRADYPALWQWSIARAAVGFGPGDGSTTFTLPNVQGRILIGAGTLGADTYAAGATGGAATRTLATGNLPLHDHGPHSHPFTTGASGGNHGDHNSDYFNAAAGGVQLYTSATPFGNAAHVHSGTTDSTTPASVGSATPTPVDVRSPYLALLCLIWT